MIRRIIPGHRSVVDFNYGFITSVVRSTVDGGKQVGRENKFYVNLVLIIT